MPYILRTMDNSNKRIDQFNPSKNISNQWTGFRERRGKILTPSNACSLWKKPNTNAASTGLGNTIQPTNQRTIVRNKVEGWTITEPEWPWIVRLTTTTVRLSKNAPIGKTYTNHYVPSTHEQEDGWWHNEWQRQRHCSSKVKLGEGGWRS